MTQSAKLDRLTPIVTQPAPRATILLVDDDEILVRALARVLRARGFAVLAATDVAGAHALLASRRFDAVVTDIRLPGASGVDVLRFARERGMDVPVVLMTGDPAVETAVEAIQYGALLYLTKPFAPERLVAALDGAIAERSSAVTSVGRRRSADLDALDASFERALSTLWMAYQPLVRAADGSLFGYEALLRSREPALPNPGAVLDAAERLGRLTELGGAIRTAAAAPFHVGDGQGFLFVNLHPRDLLDPSLLRADTPLARMATRVVLEVTERASLDEVEDACERVGRLRDMGFRIAIDDLGAGYAGLTSFASLRPEIVKLDMSLVRDVHRDATRRKLIASMTTLCRDMGMLVVAEGIENREERDTLVELRCDLLQGYFIARPGVAFPSVGG